MKLSNILLLVEDVNVKDLHPNSVGMYTFLQALNKVGSSAPIPIPTVDIIPNHELDRNPGNFSFSKSSFKIEFNPKATTVDFTGAGHDIFHAITVGMAQKFSRQRPKQDKQQKAFLSPDDKASKFNLRKQVSMEKQLRKTLALLGFEVPKQLTPEYLQQLIVQVRGMPKSEELTKLIQAVSDQRPTKSHYQKSFQFSPISGMVRPMHPQAAGKYGDFKTLNLQQVLPQYDLEEDFGNKIAITVESYIRGSKPIDLKDVGSVLDDLSQIGISHELTQDFSDRYKDFLMKLFRTYNKMLSRYMKAATK